MENLADYGDSSDDDSFNYSSKKRQRCITEHKYKGDIMHCKNSTDEASSSNSSWSTIKSRFIEMGYSTTTVEKAIEECGSENENAILEHILNNQGSPSDSSWCSVRTHFVSMGYSSTMVDKAIEECGPENQSAILEFILNCQGSPSDSSWCSVRTHFVSMGYSSTMVDKAIEECGPENQSAILEFISNCQEIPRGSPLSSMRTYFVRMGYSSSIVDKAIGECGTDDEFAILQSILTYQALENISHDEDSVAKSYSPDNEDMVDVDNEDMVDVDDTATYDGPFYEGLKKIVETVHPMNLLETKQLEAANQASTKSVMSSNKKPTSQIQEKSLKKHNIIERVSSKHVSLKNGDGNMTLLSPRDHKRMLGFGVPGHPLGQCHRQLNEFAQGPPYFYFENVACTPKGVWETISRFLYDIDPEFVDSKYFSVSSRKRGYVHNLPIENRFQISPLPPMTIKEAFPDTQKYWPSWDYRTKLNCINTVVGSAPLCDRMRSIITSSNGNPSIDDQARVIYQCKKWNLVWVGPDQLAPLEPHEIEIALGFDVGHTRGSSTRTERIRSLGNSFQVDTVGYHLSVLKHLYPNGINVLSLFSGIGGAEVALHRLGITLKYVVSAEICKENKLILRSWWEKTEQKGELIEVEDVQNLTEKELEDLVDKVGGFDLIIGGSPCNNLTGSNRCTRDGLEGKHSSLFFEFPRIVNVVRHIMRSNGTAKKS